MTRVTEVRSQMPVARREHDPLFLKPAHGSSFSPMAFMISFSVQDGEVVLCSDNAWKLLSSSTCSVFRNTLPLVHKPHALVKSHLRPRSYLFSQPRPVTIVT